MRHYELVFRTAHAGTSFFIRAEEDDDAVRRVVLIASSFDTPEPARIELSCNGRPIACEALAALAGRVPPSSPDGGGARPIQSP